MISPIMRLRSGLTRVPLPLWGLLIMLSMLFLWVPQIDLTLAGWFWSPEAGFPFAHRRWVLFLNRTIDWLARLWLLVLLIALVGGSVRPRWRRYRLSAAYLLIVLLLAPALIVNGILKEHWGRARPIAVTEFGGDRQFTPAWVVADQCEGNCSFVSGHVAISVYPVVGYHVAATRRARRRWLSAGLIGGALMGIERMGAGAHFFSDVVLAMLLVIWVAWFIAGLMFHEPSAVAAPRPSTDAPDPQP